MAIPKDLTKGNYHYLYMAKLAEQAERYEDMANYMNKLVTNATASGRELTVEERNLLSSAYKNVVDSLRAARLMVSSVDQKEKVRNNVVSDYRSKVESELSDFCTSVINLLDDNLLPSTVDNESKVFYLKMKGDYHRYLAEFKTGDERKSAVDDTVNAYKTAALTGLRPTHPIRLGVALNFAVFYYEVLNAADEACTMAEQAFVEAMEELDLLRKGDGAYKDSTLIMRLLRDNLVVWTSDRQVYSNFRGDLCGDGISRWMLN